MKTFKFYFATFMMALAFAACSGDDADNTGGQNNKSDDPEKPTQVEMKISVLLDADKQDQAVPRLVAEWGDNMFAQVVDPNHPEVTMFQYINSDKGEDIVAVVSEHNIIFMHYNPVTDKDFPENVLIASDDDNFSTLSSCKVDWKNNKIDKYGKTVPFSSKSAKAKTRMATRGENDLIKKPFFDMFDEMSTNISKIKEKMEVFGALGKSATLLCDIWTEGLIPVMKYQLYDDDKIAQQQYVQDYFTGKTMDYIKDKINGKVDDGMDKATDYLCKITGVDREHVNMGVWAYDNLIRPKLMTDEKPAERTNELVNSGMQAALDFSEKVVAADPIFNETQDVPDEGDEEWWDEDDDDDDEDEWGDDDDDDDEVEWGDGDDDDDDDEDGGDDDDEDNEDDVIGWWGTTWNFSGTLTVNDPDEPGPYTDNISMTIEFPESGGVKISGGGDLSELAGSSKVRFEETVNGMIITISGSSRDTSDGLDTVNWAYTLTLNHTSATQAVMSWNGQESYSGWYYVGKDKKTYSGAISTSGQLTGTRTN
ncbi:MAG: hypothetical protein IJR84_03810 [Bacteroidaceae bacterium]|nr:hypothetical protein [Bacteroidaceae bacterium]